MTNTVSFSLDARIRELIASGEFQLPPMPEVALRLRAVLEDEDSTTEQIVDLIRGEPAVTATLLKTANSAALGFRATSDLSQVISRLGRRQTLSIVVAVLMKGQFETGLHTSRQTVDILWGHAIASATIAKHLAEQSDYPPDDAFLAGLLHGIGRLITRRALDQVGQLNGEDGQTPTPAEADALVELMQHELGYTTLRDWNFTEDICEAARAMSPDVEGAASPIIGIVQAADLFTKKLGFHPHPDPALELEGLQAVAPFVASEEALPGRLANLERAIEEVRSTFGSA